jgi:hypothetical protein
MKKILSSLIFSLGLSVAAFAQTASHFSLDYSMGFPANSGFSDFAGGASFTGFNVSLIRYINDNWGFGASIGWNDFYEKDVYSTVEVGENVAVTGTFRKSVYVTPVTGNVRYRFVNNDKFEATGGFDLGAYFMRQQLQVSIYYSEEAPTKFGVTPNLGFMYKINPNFGIQARGRYHLIVDGATNFVENPSYISAEIGLVFIDF